MIHTVTSRLFSRPEFSQGTALSSTPRAQVTCKDGGGGGWGVGGGGSKQAYQLVLPLIGLPSPTLSQ